MKKFSVVISSLALVAILLVVAHASQVSTGRVTRVSVSSSGEQANMHSYYATISEDGRYVALSSSASNLVPDDTNLSRDIFVHDRRTGETTRVSVSSDGEQANGDCYRPTISGDGNRVVFQSEATNLGSESNGPAYSGVYVHDRATGETVGVPDSLAYEATAVANPDISRDGRFVAFIAGDEQVKVYDMLTGESSLVSVSSTGEPSTGGNSRPSISGDRRYVAFASTAANLVDGDINAERDIFVHDRQTGATICASTPLGGGVANGRSEYPKVSKDGDYVLFLTTATNLGIVTPNQGLVIYDIPAQKLAGPFDFEHNWINAVFSADGRYVGLLGYGGYNPDRLLVHDRHTGTRMAMELSPKAYSYRSGTWVAYQAWLSANGHSAVFGSVASDVVPGDTNGFDDIFVYDFPILTERLLLPMVLR